MILFLSFSFSLSHSLTCKLGDIIEVQEPQSPFNPTPLLRIPLVLPASFFTQVHEGATRTRQLLPIGDNLLGRQITLNLPPGTSTKAMLTAVSSITGIDPTLITLFKGEEDEEIPTCSSISLEELDLGGPDSDPVMVEVIETDANLVWRSRLVYEDEDEDEISDGETSYT